MYDYVCVAGTFDGLHKGHEALLLKALESGRRVLIGLTSDAYTRAHKKSTAPYAERLAALSSWLSVHDPDSRARVTPIHDPYEPAVSSREITALVVSQETHVRGQELNRKRRVTGLPPLALITVPMVTAADRSPISSTRVRKGDVDRNGNLVMPTSMRVDLSRPFGPVLSTPRMQQESFATHREDSIVTVGDLTTKTLLDAGVTPMLMVVDGHVERKEYPLLMPIIERHGFPMCHVVSGPGFISHEAIETIRSVLDAHRGPTVIEVDGEEDLLALPAIAEAPVGSVVYYGQPEMAAWACGPSVCGIVEVVVTAEQQLAANRLLASFVR